MEYKYISTHIRQYIFLMVFIVVSMSTSFAQPIGGIGSFDGSTSPQNVLWLKADAGVTLQPGNLVSGWDDQTGNGLNAVQPSGAIQPSFTATNASLNNLPSISFGPTGSANYHLRIPDNILLDGSSEMSFIYVLRTPATIGVEGLLNKRISNGNEEAYRFYLNVNQSISNINGGGIAQLGASVNSNYVLSTVYDQSLGGDRYFMYSNSVNSDGGSVATTLDDKASDLFIGNFNLGDNRSFSGDIAEILIYRHALTAAQKIIIENSLAEKYSINLSANDIFGNLGTYSATYFEDYTGIGSDDGSVKETEATSDALIIRENNSTLDANEFIAFAHDNTAHAGGLTSDITVDSGILDSHWARGWYIEVSQSGVVDGGDVSADLSFDFSVAGLTYSGSPVDYILLFRDDLSADYDRIYVDDVSVENGDQVVFTVPSDRMKSGYYTIGKGTQPTSKTWYVFQDGNWSDHTTWTLDASTAPIFNNPGSDIPGAQDQVIIRSGKSVNVLGTTNNIEVNSINVSGNLFLTTSVGHDFTTINGNGQIVIQGNSGSENFPQGTTSGNIGFGDKDNGGTLLIAGTGDMLLDNARVFRNVLINRTNNTDKVILAEDYTINGNLTIRNGQLQFGDGTANSRSLEIEGDVLVEDNGSTRIGSIATANANVQHVFDIKGDFTNNGKVHFTNRADFATSEDRYDPSNGRYQNSDNTGSVETIFTNSTKDQTVDCNNTTYFSRIVIDKGVDETYTLFLQTTDSAYFRLLGRANYNVDADISNPSQNLNAFAPINGTVKLDNNIIIPVLNTVSNYSIPSTSRVWIDGGYVAKTSGVAIVPYGKIEITEGTFISDVGSGVTLRGAGKLKVDGGTVRLKALRTSTQGASAQGTYEQNGGDVLISGGSGVSGDYALFSLTYPGNVFIMTGGQLTIRGRNGLGTGGLRGTVFINCDPGNQNVTGGDVFLESNTTTDFKVTTRAPFYSVTMRASIAGAGDITLGQTTSGTGSGDNTQLLAAQDLEVLNDITIETGVMNTVGSDTYGTYFNLCPGGDCQDIQINRNLIIEDNAVFDIWSGNANNMGSSTVTFNGAEYGYIYVGNITTYTSSLVGYVDPEGASAYSDWELPFYNLIVDKPGAELSFQAKNPFHNTNTGVVKNASGKNVYSWRSNIAKVVNEFEIKNGTINQIDSRTLQLQAPYLVSYSVRLYSNEININGELFTYEEGVTPKEACVKFRVDAGGIDLTATDISSIGNVRINLNGSSGGDTLVLKSDLYIKRLEFRHGKVNLSTHNLKVDILDYNLATTSEVNTAAGGQPVFDNNNFFLTAGNNSDKGFSLKWPRTVSLSYPEYNTINNSYNQERLLYFPLGQDNSPSNGALNMASVYFYDDPSTFSDEGYVTIRLVNAPLATVNASEISGDLLQVYWRVDYQGFDSQKPTVAHVFGYQEGQIAGTETNYVAGKILDSTPFTRSSENITNIKTGGDGGVNGQLMGNNPRNILVFNGNTTTPTNARFIQNNGTYNWTNFPGGAGYGFELTKANYTAGAAGYFTGSVRKLYARRNGEWFDPNTWSTTEGGAAISGPSELPTNGDVIIIGTSTNNYHVAICDGLNGDNCSGTNYAPIQVAQVSIIRKGSGESSILSLDETASVHDLGFVTHISPDDPADVDDGSKFAVTSSSMPQGDFGEYASASNAIFVFSRRFPANVTSQRQVKDQSNSNISYNYTPAYTIANNITEYPNIQFEYTGGSSGTDPVTLPDVDFTVNGQIRFWRSGSYVNYIKFNNSVSGGDMLVKGDFRLNQQNATIEFPATGGERTLFLESDLNFENTTNGIITIEDGGDGSLTHKIAIMGDILNPSSSSRMELFRDAAKTAVDLEFYGNENSEVEGFSVIPELNQIIADKDDLSDEIIINSDFNLGVDSGAGSSPIELIGGNLVLNHTNIDIDLTTDGDFEIPSGAGLELASGKANISGDDTALILDGKLTISGGELDMATGVGNGNNFIEYSASGNASIEVTDGVLSVGSQVRRSTTSTSGVLKYNQTGGVATFGSLTAPVNDRGVFEVLNTGSEFNLDIDPLSGDEFTIVRDNNSTTVASLRLSPDVFSISDGSVITLGNADTPAAQNDLGIHANIPIKGLHVADGDITAKIYGVPLIVDELEVTSSAVFNANSFDITINGLLQNDGIFMTSGNSSNGQTTFFTSNAASDILGSGTTNFWDFEKSGTGTLTLSKDITVDNNAALNGGVLDTDVSAFNLKKDLLHNATHTSDAAGPGIIFNGTQQQNLDRSGPGTSYFGVVNLDNAAGLKIADTEEDFQIDEKMVLTTGVLDIGGNLLIFPIGAGIENGVGGSSVTDFNKNRMIQTNSSIRDFGVRKFFPATVSGSINFIYPVGLNSYTPVVMDLTDISAGQITVRPVADIPPIAEDDEFDPPTCTDPDLVDADNVLQYYWIIKSSGISGLQGSMKMYYDPFDIKIESPDYTVANYGPARLYNQDNSWDKVFTEADFDEVANIINFPFANNDNATLEGIYTAGVTLRNDGTTLLCGAAIPDIVPQFITLEQNSSGDIFVDGSYQAGVAPNPGSSFDLIIKPGFNLMYDVSNVRTRKVTIESGATLEVASGTNNHNLGFVTGEGNIKLVSNTTSISFPTGDYDQFFPDINCNNGGGLEFSGTGSYAVLSGLPRVRNVIFSGSGDRTLPNNHSLLVCEDLEILGSVELIVPDGNNNTVVKRNIYKSDVSSFDNGGGSSTVVLNGSGRQYIRGDFTANDAFNNLEVDNVDGMSVINGAIGSRGISANANVDVEGSILFSNGIIVTDADNDLRLRLGGTLSGYGTSRYIDGPFVRELPNNTQVYDFPVGDGWRYGYMYLENPGLGGSPKDWTVQYYNSVATDHAAVDNMTPTDAMLIPRISGNEYWVINDGTASTSDARALVGLSWDGNSEVSPDATERQDLTVMEWNDATSSWDSKGGKSHTGSSTFGTLSSDQNVDYYEAVVTLGSQIVNNPLPVELVSFNGVDKDGKIELRWETASELNNDYFTIEHSVDGRDFVPIGNVDGNGTSTIKMLYSFLHQRPTYSNNYYRLKQVDYDGAFEYSDVIVVRLNQLTDQEQLDFVMYPNPTSGNSIKIQLAGADFSSNMDIQVLNLSGTVIHQQRYRTDELQDEVELDFGFDTVRGIYLVKLIQGNGSIVKKLILK